MALPISKATAVTTVKVAGAAAAQANTSIASFNVADTAANILANLPALAADTHLGTLSMTDATRLTVSFDQFSLYRTTLDKLVGTQGLALNNLLTSQALVVATDTHVKAFSVKDSAANVLANLPRLAAESRVTSIDLTDSVITINGAAAFTADKLLLDKLVAGDSFVATNITVAQAASAQADTHCSTFTVSDSAANVQAALNALNADTHLTHVTLSDGAPLLMTSMAFTYDKALLSKLDAGVVTVTGLTAANAIKAAADVHVGHVVVNDTLAHIGSNLDALEALAKAGKLGGINVTDTGQTLTLTAAQAAADHDAIAQMTGSFTIKQPPAPSGFHLNLIYDASMASAPAGFKAALDAAVQYFQSIITSNETVTLQVGFGEVGGQAISGGVLGAAGPARGVTVTYDMFKAAYTAHATTAEQKAVAANMGADPTNGGHIFVASAEAKALGLMSANDTGVDGIIGFAADTAGSLFDYNRADGISAGMFDFLGVVEHEISHTLGRYAWLDQAGGNYSAMDLMRYSAPGAHTVNAATNAYFSIDGGTTALDWFATGGDAGDWAASAGNDAATAFATPGVVNLFSQADVTVLNALGYALA